MYTIDEINDMTPEQLEVAKKRVTRKFIVQIGVGALASIVARIAIAKLEKNVIENTDENTDI